MDSKEMPVDVAWLDSVTRAPARVPRDKLRPLAGVLLRENADPVKTRREWIRHRQTLRAAWMRFLGPMPERPISADFEVLRDEKLTGVRRQLIRYEAEAGQPVEAYLLFPRTAARTTRPRPGIVALHQTTGDTIEQIAGVKGPLMQQIGLQLARRGFVVICPRNYLWQNVTKYLEAVDKFRRRHPGTLGMHKMLYDSQRAVDILAALPGVDADRIGATGHSLGGKETLYLAAFDERIAAAVASEGGVGFRFTNWNAPWYLGKGIDKDTFPLNHHQLLALAVGAKTIKMHQGHRGANHPVKRLSDGLVEITAMNHGFAGDADTLPANVKPTHVSLFDGSNCGIELTDKQAFSVQYHPEASPGPQDSFYLFKRFVDGLKGPVAA